MWGSWSGWAGCSGTCQTGGTESRHQNCDNPAPEHGGQTCEVHGTQPTESRSCDPCPGEAK